MYSLQGLLALMRPELDNQVEVISKFKQCDQVNLKFKDNQKADICGVQYIASYGSKVGDPSVHAIKTNKYKLTFKFIEN